jgi:hypothetical protein
MDTGAGRGLWIAYRIVDELDFDVGASEPGQQARVGNDEVITSRGSVKLTWKLARGTRSFTERFSVFESDHFDVIIGMDFLRLHQVVPYFDLTHLMPLAEARPESAGKFDIQRPDE